MAWIMQNGVLTNTGFVNLPDTPLQGDSPYTIWRIGNDNAPYVPLMPEQPLLGAFANATKLKRVSIPRSVKYIGANAFTNTQLRSVTIASDCTYFDTSFPEGCVVNFYPD